MSLATSPLGAEILSLVTARCMACGDVSTQGPSAVNARLALGARSVREAQIAQIPALPGCPRVVLSLVEVRGVASVGSVSHGSAAMGPRHGVRYEEEARGGDLEVVPGDFMNALVSRRKAAKAFELLYAPSSALGILVEPQEAR